MKKYTFLVLFLFITQMSFGSTAQTNNVLNSGGAVNGAGPFANIPLSTVGPNTPMLVASAVTVAANYVALCSYGAPNVGNTQFQVPPYIFTVTSANATLGSVYSNNGVNYTTITTIAAGTTLTMSGNSPSLTSGTLTKVSGTGDATITFSTVIPGKNFTALGFYVGSSTASNSNTVHFGYGIAALVAVQTPTGPSGNQIYGSAAVNAVPGGIGVVAGAPAPAYMFHPFPISFPAGSYPYAVWVSATATSDTIVMQGVLE